MGVGRGSLVIAALPGDIGKTRPVLVIQTDAYPGTTAVAVVPLTSDLHGPAGPRIEIAPSPENGLREVSRIMIDKPGLVRRFKVGPEIGRISASEMALVDRALTLFLGIGDR